MPRAISTLTSISACPACWSLPRLQMIVLVANRKTGETATCALRSDIQNTINGITNPGLHLDGRKQGPVNPLLLEVITVKAFGNTGLMKPLHRLSLFS